MPPTDAEIAAADPAVLTAEQAASAAADTTTLPPAGDARRDALKARADSLREAADKLEGAAGIHAVDPRALKPENEIARYAGNGGDGSEVSNALPAFVYVWEQADLSARHGGLWVTQAKSVGWEVVQGDMPEAIERKYVDGTRRWGDTILLRIPRHRYEELQNASRRRRLARSEGISLAVLEQAERAGIKVHDLTSPNLPPHIAQAQRAAAEAARATYVSRTRQARGMRGQLASEIANRRLDAAIRTGTVPGMPAAS